MGQSASITDSIIQETVDTVSDVPYKLLTNAKNLVEINNLTRETFMASLDELNELSKNCLDSNNRCLHFCINPGTADTFLWKATVEIVCSKVNADTQQYDSTKCINLKQFLRIFKTFQSHLQVMQTCEESQYNSRSPSACGTSSSVRPSISTSDPINASILMHHIEEVANMHHDSATKIDENANNECCICLDRKPEVMLPCSHTYCYPCIEQWNVEHKLCPICNQELKSTNDSWVLSEKPASGDISEEIYTDLMKLSKDED